ncbi:MAG: DoxX family protein [Bryobacter sp.]|nr:DoxX family protein [Bryobacter sp.]
MNSSLEKWLYWGSTGLFGAFMVFSGVMYFTNPDVPAAFTKLGFPQWFRVELATAKLLGALALVAPLPAAFRWVKEWAYAGFAINISSAVLAHYFMDGLASAFAPVPFLVVLLASRVLWGRRHANVQK